MRLVWSYLCLACACPALESKRVEFDLDELTAERSEGDLEPPALTAIEVEAGGLDLVEELIDSTYLHRTIQYNLLGFNCATLVHFLLEGYGIRCLSGRLSGRLWLPGSCECDPQLGGCERVNPEDGAATLKQYLHYEASNTKDTRDRNSFRVHNESLLPIDHKDFKVYVVLTYIPIRQEGSYHASLLLQWGSGEKDFLSFSGWPRDTIVPPDPSTAKNLFLGNFRLAFPDPTLRNVARNHNQNTDYVPALAVVKTYEEVLLPLRADGIVDVEVESSRWTSYPSQLHVAVAHEAENGQREVLKFFEMYDPPTFLQLTRWPKLDLIKDDDSMTWKYESIAGLDGSALEEILPFCLIKYGEVDKERFYVQRPTILRWMRFFLSRINSDVRLWQRRNLTKAKGMRKLRKSKRQQTTE